jgi:hypothetical protein
MHRTLLLAVAAFALGCKPQPKITSYEVKADAPAPATAAVPATPVAPVAKAPEAPKAPAAATPMPANAAMQAEAASFGQPKWAELPTGWTAGAPNAMRKGSWNVAGPGGSQAEVAVTVFPGNVGGTTANVNRWRGQVGLEAIAAAQIEASVQNIEANGLKITIVEATGQANGVSTTLLGAIVPHEGQTWFFKLIGPAALITREQTAFREFLSTIKPR